MPSMRQLAGGSLLAAAAVVTLSIRAHRATEVPGPVTSTTHVLVPPPANISLPAAGDVTADLIADPARTTASYDQVIEELMKLASEARPGWTDERKAAFDTQVAELRAGLDRAAPGRAQQRLQRSWIRYLQAAVVRDDVLLASGGPR